MAGQLVQHLLIPGACSFLQDVVTLLTVSSRQGDEPSLLRKADPGVNPASARAAMCRQSRFPVFVPTWGGGVQRERRAVLTACPGAGVGGPWLARPVFGAVRCKGGHCLPRVAVGGWLRPRQSPLVAHARAKRGLQPGRVPA